MTLLNFIKKTPPVPLSQGHYFSLANVSNVTTTTEYQRGVKGYRWQSRCV